jgi:glucose-6-phosphate isomerase
MKIINHCEQKEISADLLFFMEEQLSNLPHFKEFDSDDLILKDMKTILPLKRFQDILVFGIGGSSLGGQAIYEFRTNDTPKLHFVDNIDPKTFNLLMNRLDLKETGVLSISKSGNTAETLMQTLLAKQYFEKELRDSWANHFMVLTEDKDNALITFAKKYDLPTFDHNPNIGGRFCVFTNVGAVIASLCGFDFIAFRNGARDLLNKPLDELLKGAMHLVNLNQNENVNQSVMLVYGDALEKTAAWYAQLFAESIGKTLNEKRIGLTPVSALGAVDQHSQLQLYLDGPRDKLISYVTIQDHESTLRVQPLDIDHPSLTPLYNKTMDQLFYAEQQGTLQTLKKNGCHIREFNLEAASPYELGQFMIYHVIETIAVAYLLEINPFDQPAVEEGKIRAMSLLKDMI